MTTEEFNLIVSSDEGKEIIASVVAEMFEHLPQRRDPDEN